MPLIVNSFILAAYIIALYVTGLMIVAQWYSSLPALLARVGSMLAGIGVGVPATYVFACAASSSREPIAWGVILYILTVLTARYLAKDVKLARYGNLSMSDKAMVVFSFACSAWIMTKTFRAGEAGQLFVGSNNVFDFGHALGIVRSFSWGGNIPFASPFQAGLPFLYHFSFYFFVAIWEYFGVPIVWAMNIPSALSFASLLIVVYYLPQMLAKQKAVVGWVAVLLTITHSTLSFWHMVIQKGVTLSLIRSIWTLPTYPFAGPFDGSVISIFMTLNNYVNQRHLAFAAALGLFLIIVLARFVDEKKMSVVPFALHAVIAGVLFLWNMGVFAVTAASLGLLCACHKKWKWLVVFIAVVVVVTGAALVPYVSFLEDVPAFMLGLTGWNSSGATAIPRWSALSYFWHNLGILPLVAVLGIIVLPRLLRRNLWPFIILFIVECVFAGAMARGFDQKFLSFLIIGTNAVAAVGIGWLWQNKSRIMQAIAVLAVFILTASGVMDLMVIKNEFAYPLVATDTAPLISWIKDHTPTDAVFVSYADMIDPVVIAGRKNFYGFFGNVGAADRSPTVRRVYGGDAVAAKTIGISYVVVPRWEKTDFPYTVDVDALEAMYPRVYEDKKHTVFSVR